jgi:N-acyl homoserine lactone hydrolase
MAAARGEAYTFPELIDFTGARYEEVDGEAEIWPGVWVIPTPGHVDGHQSLVIEKPDGTVVLAGQAHDFATQFGADQMARQAALDGVEPPLPAYAPWLDRLADFDPRRVLFAHDAAVWEP